MRGRLESALLRLWYGAKRPPLPLRLLAHLFALVVALRRLAYRHLWPPAPLAVPVVVVGNLAVGGSGKTPVVLALAEHLAQVGARPGIVLRGYGGRRRAPVHRVQPDDDPGEVGDEALLLVRRSGVPVVVAGARRAGAEALIEAGCSVVLSDDGLQHYGLPRTLELAVIDGARGLGNGHCLPAGPLREPPARLAEVDAVIVNGEGEPPRVGAAPVYPLRLVAGEAVNLRTGERRALPAFADRQVHAVAGIGHPERFFAMLRGHGLRPLVHALPDHYAYEPASLDLVPPLPVLMTEKDAVKCAAFASADCWYVPVTAQLPAALFAQLDARLAGARVPGSRT